MLKTYREFLLSQALLCDEKLIINQEFCWEENFHFSPHELLHDFLHPHLHPDKADAIPPPQAEQIQQVPVGLFQYELLAIKHSHLSRHTLPIFQPYTTVKQWDIIQSPGLHQWNLPQFFISLSRLRDVSEDI